MTFAAAVTHLGIFYPGVEKILHLEDDDLRRVRSGGCLGCCLFSQVLESLPRQFPASNLGFETILRCSAKIDGPQYGQKQSFYG